MISYIFLIGLAGLLYIAYLDLRYKEVDNKLILAYLVVGFAFSTINGQLFPTFTAMILMFIFCYFLWSKGLFGGADAKILIATVPWLGTIGIANTLVSLIFFILEFGIIGSIYGLVYKKFYSNEEEIPFIPAIAVAYCLFWFFKII